MKNILIDTSFIVALNNEFDKHYHAAVRFAAFQQFNGLMPEIALTEIFNVLAERRSYAKAVKVIKTLSAGAVQFVQLTSVDFQRINEIMYQYLTAKFDLVDASIMAFSERLNITSVLTFDRRDFPIFRPKHTDYLELLPYLTTK